MEGVLSNTDGSAGGVNVHEGGQRGTKEFAGCIYYVLPAGGGAASTPGND